MTTRTTRRARRERSLIATPIDTRLARMRRATAPVGWIKDHVRRELKASRKRSWSERFTRDDDASKYEQARVGYLDLVRMARTPDVVFDQTMVEGAAYIMVACVHYRRWRHLERLIEQYETAIFQRREADIERLCSEVERVAQVMNYDNHRRLMSLHTMAEVALTQIEEERELARTSRSARVAFENSVRVHEPF